MSSFFEMSFEELTKAAGQKVNPIKDQEEQASKEEDNQPGVVETDTETAAISPATEEVAKLTEDTKVDLGEVMSSEETEKTPTVDFETLADLTKNPNEHMTSFDDLMNLAMNEIEEAKEQSEQTSKADDKANHESKSFKQTVANADLSSLDVSDQAKPNKAKVANADLSALDASPIKEDKSNKPKEDKKDKAKDEKVKGNKTKEAKAEDEKTKEAKTKEDTSKDNKDNKAKDEKVKEDKSKEANKALKPQANSLQLELDDEPLLDQATIQQIRHEIRTAVRHEIRQAVIESFNEFSSLLRGE